MDAPALRTERLVILPLSSADIDEVAALYGDLEVMRHVSGGILTRAQTNDALATSERSWEVNGWGLWAIRDATTGGLLGEGGVRPFTEIADVAANFGVTLGRRSWGSGLATEAGRAILADTWTRFAGPLIHAVVQPDNKPSAAVLRHLGFTLTGVQNSSGQPLQIWVIGRHG